MVPVKTAFVIFVLISGVVFSPSYSFAQSDTSDNPFSSLFDIFRQIFSFNDQSEKVDEFEDAVVVHTSSTSTTESNIPPTANAGPDQEVLEFATVTLNGTSSTDVDGTIVSYEWTQVSDPKVILSSNSTVTPTFTAPEVESDDITLRFSLLVTDNSGDSSSDEVEITVKNVNSPPIANAGPDQEVLEFATVTLNGTSSTDVDGTITSYLWSQLSGANVTLSSLSDVTPTFTAPSVDSQNILKFSLKVTDNLGDSSSDEVEITVNDSDNNDDNNNDDNNNDDNNNDDNNNDDNNNDDNNNDEIEIEAEVNNNTKIKVKIGEDEYKFTLPGELTDDEIIQFIADELDLDENLVRDLIKIQRENNDDNEKIVTICHIPPGNEGNPQTLRVGSSALSAHLSHGDTVGECSNQSQNFKNNNSGKDNSNQNNSGNGNKNETSEDKNNSENEDNKTKSENENNNSGKGNTNESKSQNSNEKKNNKKDD